MCSIVPETTSMSLGCVMASASGRIPAVIFAPACARAALASGSSIGMRLPATSIERRPASFVSVVSKRFIGGDPTKLATKTFAGRS